MLMCVNMCTCRDLKDPLKCPVEALRCLFYTPSSSAWLRGVDFERTEVGQLSQGGECCQNCLGLHSHRTGAVGKKLSFLAAFALSFLPHILLLFLIYIFFTLPWSTRQEAAKYMQHAGCQGCMMPSFGAGDKNKSLSDHPQLVVHGLDILGMWGSKTNKSRETVGLAQTHPEHSCFLTFSNPC